MINSRRKFLVQGGMVTTALLAAKPFQAMASITSPFTGNHLSQVTFLHTTHSSAGIIDKINQVRRAHPNPVLLHAAGNENEHTNQSFDAVAGTLDEHFSGTYQLINKGAFRIGVIETTPADWNAADKISHLAAHLKKEEGCHFVICLSPLGFRSRNSIDDLRLAERSEQLDCIIGKQTAASPPLPFIAQNKKKEEVIIHYSGNTEEAIGKMMISFNQSGNKQQVQFDHRFHPAGKKA